MPAVEWCAAAELEASSDVWFKYSPPPRRPPPPPSGRRKKARRPATTEEMDGRSYGGGGKGGLQHRRAATPASARTSSSDTAARSLAGKVKAGAARARVVRPVDADLYQVPPPEFLPGDDEPRRRRVHVVHAYYLLLLSLTHSGTTWLPSDIYEL